MVFKGFIAAATAVALSVAPTVAAAQAVPTEVAPAAERVDGSELRGGFIIPLVAIVAIILGVLAAVHEDDEELPPSP